MHVNVDIVIFPLFRLRILLSHSEECWLLISLLVSRPLTWLDSNCESDPVPWAIAHISMWFFNSSSECLESALCICGSVHSQRFGQIYTQNVGLFFFILIFLFSSYFQTSAVVLNSVLWFFWPETLWVFMRILYTTWSILFPSSKCQLFTIFDYNFQSPLPLGFLYLAYNS